MRLKSLGPLFVQCFDTVGWVFWPIKTVPYNVFGRTLNLAQFNSIQFKQLLTQTLVQISTTQHTWLTVKRQSAQWHLSLPVDSSQRGQSTDLLTPLHQPETFLCTPAQPQHVCNKCTCIHHHFCFSSVWHSLKSRFSEVTVCWKKWCFRPNQNCPLETEECLRSPVQQCGSYGDGGVFQVAGAAMWKLRLPSSVVVLCTARSLCCADQRLTWPERVTIGTQTAQRRCLGQMWKQGMRP